MAEKGTRQKRYSDEFKLQAAKLIVEGGYTYAKASQQLGVSDWALRCWVNGFRASGQLPPKGQVIPLAEEFKALRKQMAQLWLENEILEKAAYFAKESLCGMPGYISNETPRAANGLILMRPGVPRSLTVVRV